ncbi:hypothetical protein [Pseudactinotalea terrae]|uniref:hypothetical protein n=1 Tax=Pseudactinotalea terrae TaxID=1743262 RepID=UPI0013908A2A|nr:hypothetical protein [Pseudactinotalea terrae]
MHAEPGKIVSTFLGFEDHGIFTAQLTVDYGGSGQGVGGYNLGGDTGFGAAFIKAVLRAAGVDAWEKLPGRVVRVLLEDEGWGRVVGLEPMPFESGERVIFADLVQETERTAS